MKGVRADLFALVPVSIEDAVSVNTIAARADVAHHIVREHLVAFVRDGTVVTTNAGRGCRYYRSESLTKRPSHVEPRVGERVILALPKTEAEAITIRDLGTLLNMYPSAINSAMKPYRDHGHVLRVGRGGPSDPYRYYVDMEFQLDDDGHVGPIAPPTPADVLDLVRAAESGENEAVTASVAPDQDDAGTEIPPDPEPRGTSPLQAVAEILDPFTPEEVEEIGAQLAAGRGQLGTAYRRVAQDLRLRARDAQHDARMLDAGAELLDRILVELEP